MEQIERRILGTEKITLLDGSEKEINIYAVGFTEKMRLVTKFTETKLEKGYQYKIVNELAIRDEVMKIAFKDIDFEQLDYNAETLYEKYFTKKPEEEKKEKTSTTGPMATESPKTAQQ